MMRSVVLAALFVLSAFAFAQEDVSAPAIETDYSSPLTILSGETEHAFTVEISATQAEVSLGMMHRPEMAADTGMLFDLGETRMAGFFMRNTLVSLDILFISKAGEVMSIAHNAVPLSERNISSGLPVAYVLELKGGQSEILGIKPGDTVKHELIGNNG